VLKLFQPLENFNQETFGLAPIPFQSPSPTLSELLLTLLEPLLKKQSCFEKGAALPELSRAWSDSGFSPRGQLV